MGKLATNLSTIITVGILIATLILSNQVYTKEHGKENDSVIGVNDCRYHLHPQNGPKESPMDLPKTEPAPLNTVRLSGAVEPEITIVWELVNHEHLDTNDEKANYALTGTFISSYVCNSVALSLVLVAWLISLLGTCYRPAQLQFDIKKHTFDSKHCLGAIGLGPISRNDEEDGLVGYILTILLLAGAGIAVVFIVFGGVFEAIALSHQPYRLPWDEAEYDKLFKHDDDHDDAVEPTVCDYSNLSQNNAVRRVDNLETLISLSISACVAIVFMVGCIRYDHLVSAQDMTQKTEYKKKDKESGKPLLREGDELFAKIRL